MGLGAEAFTVLAILEARDRASEIFERVTGVMDKFGETAAETADSVKGSSDEIDESLLQTASGADALELATAKVAAAQERATAAAQAQADAEERLLAVTARGVASEDDLAAAAAAVTSAQGRAAEAQDMATAAARAQAEALVALGTALGDNSAAAGLSADANGRLRDAQGRFVSSADAQQIALAAVAEAEEAGVASADALAAANDRLAEAQKLAADSAAEVAAAQAKQAGLGSVDGQVAAAQNLAKAEKTAQGASNDLSAAQAKQSTVQKTLAASTDEAKAAALAEADAQKKAAADAESSAAFLSKAGKVAGITAIGLGIVGGLAIKAAGNFQSLTEHLVTDAGESQSKLQMVRAGILSISSATGTSATAVDQAMYHIESSGQHGAAGLGVLKVAAQGAKVGNADLGTVAKTLVGTLVSYGKASSNAGTETKNATGLMNELIKTVGSGDMQMSDLASSLGNVTPVASRAGISFAQVGGAIATMTAQNMSAKQATQDLAHTISSLQSPTTVQTQEMAQLGLNSQTVASQLGSKGLTGTIGELTQAITSHMGQSGQVLMSAFNKSTAAAQDAQIMLGHLPASIQGVAKAYLAGTATYTTFNDATKGVGLTARTLADQFATTAGKAQGFNNLLKSGQPAAQTYNAALSKMVGGQTGLKTALMLTGSNAGVFNANVIAIGKAANKTSGDVDGWAAIQGTFNQKVDLAKTALENTGIAIGSAILPAATKLFTVIGKIVIPIAEWTAKHKTLTAILFVGVTALAATVAVLALAVKAFKAVKGVVDDVGKAAKGASALIQKLGKTSKETADTQAKSAKEAASAQEKAAGESATVQEEKSAEAAAAQEADAGEVAGANEVAAAESSSSWVTAAATTVAGWATAGAGMVASAAKWVAQGAVKVATYVATNVAGAAVTAAAWIAANAVLLLGIGLVIAAVVIAVVEIVKHWKQITAAVSKVWDDIYDYVSGVITKVVNFVKSHWELLLAILTGPVGVAALEISKHLKDIEGWFKDAVKDIEKALSWFWGLSGRIHQAVAGALTAVVSEGGKIVRWFEALPGKVLAEVEKLATDLFSSGEHIIESLAHGIESAASGALHGAMNFVTSTIKSFLPFSPAKQGPLSGSGDPSYSGRSIASKVATGITAGTPALAAAAAKMASTVHAATSGLTAGSGTPGIGSSLAASAIGSAGSGGNSGAGTVIYLTVSGNTVMSDSDINKLTQRIGNKLATTHLPQAGRQVPIRG